MGTTSLAARLASLAVAATSSLLFVATAHATHEDLVLGVSDNKVRELSPKVVDLGAQSQFATRNGFLELRIDDLERLLPANSDLCDAQISMTADALNDGLTADRTREPFLLQVPPR